MALSNNHSPPSDGTGDGLDQLHTEAGAPDDPAAGFPIVAVGASAGGLEAFTQFLSELPLQTGMAFVLLQHLEPSHPSQLTALLAKTTRLPVAEIVDGMVMSPDNVYVIPPNTSLTTTKGTLHLYPRGDAHQLHTPVDYFFRSLAADRGNRAIGVILSGTGSDGSQGLGEIKAAGGSPLRSGRKRPNSQRCL